MWSFCGTSEGIRYELDRSPQLRCKGSLPKVRIATPNGNITAKKTNPSTNRVTNQFMAPAIFIHVRKIGPNKIGAINDKAANVEPATHGQP